jgi:hypothetical protein
MNCAVFGKIADDSCAGPGNSCTALWRHTAALQARFLLATNAYVETEFVSLQCAYADGSAASWLLSSVLVALLLPTSSLLLSTMRICLHACSQ